MSEKMTRTQKAEEARKRVEALLKLNFPETEWLIRRHRDSIIINTHGGHHTMGVWTPACILPCIENGELLKRAGEHVADYGPWKKSVKSKIGGTKLPVLAQDSSFNFEVDALEGE